MDANDYDPYAQYNLPNEPGIPTNWKPMPRENQLKISLSADISALVDRYPDSSLIGHAQYEKEKESLYAGIISLLFDKSEDVIKIREMFKNEYLQSSKGYRPTVDEVIPKKVVDSFKRIFENENAYPCAYFPAYTPIGASTDLFGGKPGLIFIPDDSRLAKSFALETEENKMFNDIVNKYAYYMKINNITKKHLYPLNKPDDFNYLVTGGRRIKKNNKSKKTKKSKSKRTRRNHL